MTTLDDGVDLRFTEGNHDLSNEPSKAYPRVVQQAWPSSDYQGSVSLSSHEHSRVSRDSTFNSRKPQTNLGQPDGYRSSALTRTGQPGLFDDCDGVPRTRTRRRNSVSSYLPSHGVNNTSYNSNSSDGLQPQGARNSFHQVNSQKFQNQETFRSVQKDVIWDHNSNNVKPQQLELNFSQDLSGSRRINRRHSVTSLSSSYSADNSSSFDLVPGYTRTHADKSHHLQKQEIPAEKLKRRASFQSESNSEGLGNVQGDEGAHFTTASSARSRRRASSGIIGQSHVGDRNLVQESDEGLQNLICALQRDIYPQNFQSPAKIPEKTNVEFRNRIPKVRDSTSLLISNQNLLSGSHVEVHETGQQNYENPVAIHLPDSGACPVTPRQEPVKRAPSLKDTHISLVYSKDLSVDDSLDDALICAQSGVGTNFKSKSYKNEKKNNLLNSQGQGQLKSQGHYKTDSETFALTIKKDKKADDTITQSNLNEISPAKNQTNLEQSRTDFHSPKSKNNDSNSENSETSSELDNKVTVEKGLKTDRPCPGYGQGHSASKCRPTGRPQKDNSQELGTHVEGINDIGKNQTNGTCFPNSQTSVKLSQGTDNLCLDNSSVVPQQQRDKDRCITSRHREDICSENNSVENNFDQSASRNGLVQVASPAYSENYPRNTSSTPFDRRPVKFEPRTVERRPGWNRPRSYSLDSGTQGLLRQASVSQDDSSSGNESSDVEPSSIDSDSNEETEKHNKKYSKKKTKETKSKKSSVLAKIKRSFTVPDGLLSFIKKPLRKSRPSTSDIYTISEEISAEVNSLSPRDQRPKSLSDQTQLDDAFVTFAEKAKQQQELRETEQVSTILPKKGLTLLRRKSLYDNPEIFEQFVKIVDEAGIQSQESVLSGDTATTNESVFERQDADISSTGESDNESSETESEYESEGDSSPFNRFSTLRTSVRRASIDIGCLDQAKRTQRGKVFENIFVSASLSDHNLEGSQGNLNQRCSDGRMMGYAMAQNKSSHNSMHNTMVAEAGSNSDSTRDYLKEYQSKFGRLLPENSDQSEGKMVDGKSTTKSESDSSTPSEAPPSRTAQALANPSIRRFLLQSQARPSSRPASRSSSPGLTDSGPQSPKQKSLLGNTEFFFSSSENSPSDSPRGSVSEYGSTNSLRSSLRKSDSGVAMKSRLHRRRSSSEMDLDQIGLLYPEKTESAKSGRSLTDPFPDSKSPLEILELSQRSFSESSDHAPEGRGKYHSTFHDIMKRSSLKSKFHIPTFEEFKLKKKTTFSPQLDYFGNSGLNQPKSSSHQPMKGVHSKLLVEQIRHAQSMTALHEFDHDLDNDEQEKQREAASRINRLKSDADTTQQEQRINEHIAQAVQNSGCGSIADGGVLKAPPRRRHRSSDSRKSDDGLSPRGGDDTQRRPKSMFVDSTLDHESQSSLHRDESEKTLGSECSYIGAESRTISADDRYMTQKSYDGHVNVSGVTMTESDVDSCAKPKRSERLRRKKSQSMIDLTRADLEVLEQAHHERVAHQNRLEVCERSNSERSKSKHHSHRLRSGSSEHDLDLEHTRSEKHRRHKSGEKILKTKSEPVPVDLSHKQDGRRRTKSEKSRRVKESHPEKRHKTDTGLPAGDSVHGHDIAQASSHNPQHLKLDISATTYDSVSPAPSPRDDTDMGSPRLHKSKSRKSERHKSSSRSSEHIANQDLSVAADNTSMCKNLLKANSMDNLNVLKKTRKQDKDKKIKGQRPVSMGVTVNVDLDDKSFGLEAAPPVQKCRQSQEHLLSLPNSADNKSLVTRSRSDASETRKDEKRKQKNKKIRSSKSDPFDEKGRRLQHKLREARSHQHLAPDSSETLGLDSSHSFQSIGDMDEEDDTSSEVPLKKSSGRKPKKTSNVSTTSVDSGVIGHDGSHDIDDQLSPYLDGTFSIEVERVDSGVGSETKYTNKKERKHHRDEIICVDCDKPILESEHDIITEVASICKKCVSRRTERKETIQEIIDTEVSYGRDLKIIKEEFFKPMQNASLLTAEQTQAVFLNLQELMDINDRFADFLQDAVENANEQGDEDYHSVQIGKIFLDFSFMFIAFENYCVNQASASLLLEQMEKDRELLRIFLQVSQRDNQSLRRMNLKSFLMMPVQRIVKYPLLLTRLYKSTPHYNTDRELIKEAQLKIEEILDHINASAKGGSSGTKMRTKGSIMRRGMPGTAAESVEIQKVAFETIGKNRNDAFCVMMGRLNCATPTEHAHWTKKGKGLKFSPLQAVVLALGKNKSEYSVEEDLLLFPKKSHTSEALVVLLKEKNGKYVPAREPLSLDKCVISMDMDFDEVFEVHEINKETLFFKADETKENITWVRHLKYQAKDVGVWRRRRPALANIMFSKP